MKKSDLVKVFNAFLPHRTIVKAQEIEAGHINDTFFIYTEDGDDYVLQRVNHYVFKDVPALMQNMQIVTDHIVNKHKNDNKCYQNCLKVILTTDDKPYFKDDNGNFWRLNNLIKDVKSYDKVESAKIAYESGKSFGEFQYMLDDINADDLSITIVNFHDLDTKYHDFCTAMEYNNESRLDGITGFVDDIKSLYDNIINLKHIAKTANIPVRATHNDTKINNVLFDDQDNAVTVIDLDTVMPGFIHFDYSDTIRTVTNSADEDEKDLTKVYMNFEYFKAFTEGFITPIYHNLTEDEKQTLPNSASLLAYLLCLRFITDYLNSDRYFKVAYPEHNLVRAKTQYTLAKSIISQQNDIDKYFEELYAKCELQ
ncbi:phosphotransferase enzyme family protein [Francisella salina]|nr:aminoglycoside phosphotransferase family protein [Francisella salina]